VHPVVEYLRLAGATALVLLPGALVARALGQRSISALVAWTTAAIFTAWTVVFAAHGSAWLAVAVLAVVAAVAAPLALRRGVVAPPRSQTLVLAGGVVVGLLLWHVAGAVTGDALFHLGRVRKLTELGGLHLDTVNEFADGGLHPGYAFPLWHCFLALVAKLSGLDPTVVIRHEASVLAPLVCAVVWEAGAAVFRSAAAGVSVLVASFGLYCLAAGNGGSWASLGLPGTAARQLFVPSAVALFFIYVEGRRPAEAAAVGAVFGGLALVHPTYALFLLIPLAAYALVRWSEWRASAVALTAAAVPVAAVFIWLKPIVDKTISHDPGPAEKARALHHYGAQLVVSSPDHYHVAPEVIGRSGAIAVAALLAVPLAGLAIRRRWGPFVLGGSLAVLALMLVPDLFTRFSDLVSLSQSRRAAGFVPFAFAIVGGFALVMRSALLLPLALPAGVVLQLLWPGDFAYGLREGGPAAATWIAALGGGAALVVALVLRPRAPKERHGLGLAATALFVLPVAIHGFANWQPRMPADPQALPPRILRTLATVPPRSVVIASPDVGYRLVAFAPVYTVAAPVEHVANTTENRPYRRRADVETWLRTHDPAIARRYGATWAVERGRLVPLARRGP
jgi:hypothetical protein